MNDKFLFWIDLFLFHFCFAYYFHKNYDCDLFALIDTTNKPKKFFQEQKLVPFKKSWYYHDYVIKNFKKPDISYLKLFEEKYNIQLWKLIINDRIFYQYNKFYQFSSDEILSILTQECKLYEQILDEVEPDFVLMQQPPLRHSNLFYELCRARKIKTIIMNPAILGYKCFLSQESNKLDTSEQLDKVEAPNRNFKDLQKYFHSQNFNKQTEVFRNSVVSSNLEKFKAAKEFLLFSNNKNIKTHYTYFGRSKKRVLADSIDLSLKRKKRKSFIDKNFKNTIDDELFVYFPLGSDPEAQTLISVPLQNNQAEIIKQIAKSLPIEYKLYVKEHPFQEQRDWRKISEYKQIMEIPNVCLIHPSVKIHDLYKKCSLVFTLAGTAGFEAAFYEKPSITFSDQTYSILPSVFKVEQIEELPELIRRCLKIKVKSSDVNKFITLFEKNTFDYDFYDYAAKKEKYFFFSGYLIDTIIPIPKMKSFLENNKKLFDIIANEHIKKIKLMKNEN